MFLGTRLLVLRFFAESSLFGIRLADALLFRFSVTGNVSGHDEMKQNSQADVKENY